MRGMPRHRLLITACAVLVLLTSCSKKNDNAGSDLPAGDSLLSAAAQQMRDLKTTKFLITADTPIAGLALRRAEGSLTREGSAQGSAQVEQLGANVELTFVIVGDSIYLKGPTGGYQRLPLALASTIYDPSAMLDPDRGIAKVLTTGKNAKTQARETIDGRDTYRVAATFDGAVLATILPGAKGEVPGKAWIGTDPKHLIKAAFTLPAASGGNPGTATITFSAFDEPVNISAPV